MKLRRTFAKLAALLNGRRLDRELEDDIRVHLELAEDEAVGRGLSREAARLEARQRFGGIAQIKEEHRDRRSFRWAEWLAKDFVYGVKSLKRTPGFALVVVGVLGLGIGGTVAMYSIVDAVLVKPLPFPKPDQIVAVWEAPRPGVMNATTAQQFLEWRKLSGDFATLTAEQGFSAALNDQDGPVRLPGMRVTADYFKVFGTGAALGRLFRPDEDQPGAAPVAILSNAAWQTHFGAEPGILDKRILLDGQSYQVIGVLTPGAFDRDETQFWTPLILKPAEMSSALHWLTLHGRLHDGVSVERAQQKMRAIYAALVADGLLADGSANEDKKAAIVVAPLSQLLLGRNLRQSVTVAFGAVLLVLLIACANVANLLFARGAARRTELAVRTAMGAGRWRLMAQLITECLALCTLGGMLGAGIALALIRMAKPVLGQELPYTADVRLDTDALLFGIALVFGVALLTSVLPAWQASFGNLADSLKRAGRGSGSGHLKVRRGIVIGEVALSLVLLCGALLLGRSLLNLERIATGVRIENVVTTSVNLPVIQYSTAQRAALFAKMLTSRLSATPGVTSVGMSNFLPLHWISNGEGIFVPGVEKQVMIRLKRIDPGYLRTLEIPVMAGRGIEEQDRMGTPRVVLVNEALAKSLGQLAPMRQSVGTSIRLTGSDYLGKQDLITEVRIVGVIRNERTASAGSPDPLVVYAPLAQVPDARLDLVVRTQSTKAEEIIPVIRNTVREIDANLPLGKMATMQEVKDATLSGESRPAWLITAFAGIAVLLAGIGLYGVVAYSMTQRRKELGIRVALGAVPSSVLLEVLRDAASMIGGGLLLGMVGVYAMTRLVASLLFEVSPLDPMALVVGCVTMTLIGLAAAFVPAQRAARFDPMVSLREEV